MRPPKNIITRNAQGPGLVYYKSIVWSLSHWLYIYIYIRALILVVLKKYFVVFSTIKYKNKATLVESKPNNLATQLQCTTTFGCAL